MANACPGPSKANATSIIQEGVVPGSMLFPQVVHSFRGVGSF